MTFRTPSSKACEEPPLRLLGRRPVAADLVDRREVRDGLEREPRADDVRAVADEGRDHVAVARLVARDEERAAEAEAAFDEAPVGCGDGEQGRDRRASAARRAIVEADERGALRRRARRTRPRRARPRRTRPSSASNVASTNDGSSAASPAGVTRNEGSATSGSQRAVGVDRGLRARRASRPTSPPARGSGRSPGSSPARTAGGSTRRAGARAPREGRSARRRPSSRPGRARSARSAAASGSAPRACSRAARGARRGPPPAAPPTRRPRRTGRSRETQASYGRRAASSRVSSPSKRRPCCGSTDEELSGAEAATPDLDAFRERHRARLGRDGDEPVRADCDAERPQAVPVELRAAGHAVGEDEAGRPVPRLDHHRVVAAHRPLGVVDPRIVLPGRRNEPRERLPDVEPRADEQLDRVVEQSGVGAAPVERRGEARIEPARALARLHPRDVAVDRVDLAVVAEHAERLRALPGRLRVRREALVEDRPRRGPVRVARGPDRTRRAASRRRAPCRSPCGTRATRRRRRRRAPRACGPGGTAPRRRPRRTARARAARSAASSRAAVEPSADGSTGTSRQPSGSSPSARQASSTTPRNHGSRRKHIAIPAPCDAGQRRRERQQHPRAVPGHAVRGPRASVRDGGEPGEGAIDELARRTTARVGDEADAARVAFEGSIVEERRGAQGLRLSESRRNEGMRFPPVCLSASPAEAGEVAG